MVNFHLLAAEIVLLVWGTPANFNVVPVLAALWHSTLVLVVSETVPLNRGRHLYSAGWPSRCTLAHILVHLCLIGEHSNHQTSGSSNSISFCAAVKIAASHAGCRPPSNTRFLVPPPWVHNPSAISIGSAILKGSLLWPINRPRYSIYNNRLHLRT